MQDSGFRPNGQIPQIAAPVVETEQNTCHSALQRRFSAILSCRTDGVNRPNTRVNRHLPDNDLQQKIPEKSEFFEKMHYLCHIETNEWQTYDREVRQGVSFRTLP